MFKRLLGVVLLVLAVCARPGWAQSDAIRSEFGAAMRDAQSSQVLGPSEVKLLDEAVLQLPQDYTFVPVPAASRLLKAMGNAPDAHLVGVIFPGHQENWLMAVQFEKSGYIRDDAARDWNVDDLLRSVRDSTERGDAERRQQGFPEIEVLGWAEKPRYDAANHRLVWAVVARDKNSQATNEQGVNYNTYALGRDGYFKLNLVTDLKDLATQKTAADAILDSLEYADTKKYTDFNGATDKAADFSLVALVAGIAAKKLGLLAVLGNAAIEYLKFIIVAGVMLLFLLGWLIFRRAGTKSSAREAEADDFPVTIIAESSMDQPTIPQAAMGSSARPFELADYPSFVPAAAGVPAAVPASAPRAVEPPHLAASATPAAAPSAPPAAALSPMPPQRPPVELPMSAPAAASGAVLAPAGAHPGPSVPLAIPVPVPTPVPIPAPSAPDVPLIPATAQAASPLAGVVHAGFAAGAGALAALAQEAVVASRLPHQAAPGPASLPLPITEPPVAPPIASAPTAPEPNVLSAAAPPEPAAVPIDQVPLLPPVPTVTPLLEESDLPVVAEPEMVFTPRQNAPPPMSIPGLDAEPMLIFAPTPRAAPASPPPSPEPVVLPSQAAVVSTAESGAQGEAVVVARAEPDASEGASRE